MGDISSSELLKTKEYRLKRKYKRLLSHWQTQAAEVRLSEIAEILVCSPRHARTLLNEMIERGWLSWASKPGRGARGRLHCRVDESVLEHIQCNDKKTCLKMYEHHSEIGMKDSCVVIPFYRPIDRIVPSDDSGRVERNLFKLIHAGLTRFNDSGVPVPDLAHKIESINNHTVWVFHLHHNLRWHNGEFVRIEQILESLEKHLSRPTFSHVISATIGDQNTIILKLERSDATLAYRLANAVHVLSHPLEDEIGLGPFSVIRHDEEKIILNRFDSYHGKGARVEQVEYRIMAYMPKYEWTVVTLLKSGDSLIAARKIVLPEDSAGFVYLAFNERKGKLNKSQKSFIRSMARLAVDYMDGFEEIQSVENTFASANRECKSDSTPCLPHTLTLAYYWSPEVEVVMKKLARQLSYWKCELILHPIDANDWFLKSDWSGIDISVSDMRFGKSWWFSPEERICHSYMIQHFATTAFLHRLRRMQKRLNENLERYPRNARRLIDSFINEDVIMPLFKFRFKVRVASNINGVKVSSQGWPDLTKIWISDD